VKQGLRAFLHNQLLAGAHVNNRIHAATRIHVCTDHELYPPGLVLTADRDTSHAKRANRLGLQDVRHYGPRRPTELLLFLELLPMV
jgi:hypothetical protein